MIKKTKKQIFEILSDIGRPGMQSVIGFLETNPSYWTAMCHGHHHYKGGMADHALEVYNFMVNHNPLCIPSDSIAVAALFHDLGKASSAKGRGYHGGHSERSVQKLDNLGLALTEDERTAIGKHHKVSLDLVTCPLRRLLSRGDMDSTRRWKRDHSISIKTK